MGKKCVRSERWNQIFVRQHESIRIHQPTISKLVTYHAINPRRLIIWIRHFLLPSITSSRLFLGVDCHHLVLSPYLPKVVNALVYVLVPARNLSGDLVNQICKNLTGGLFLRRSPLATENYRELAST